jgi:hypothetical protein
MARKSCCQPLDILKQVCTFTDLKAACSEAPLPDVFILL